MEYNSSKTTTPDFDEEESDIPKDCDDLIKRSKVYVSSVLQYNNLRESIETCSGHYYSLEQRGIELEKMLAKLKKKKEYVENALIKSSEHKDKNNLEFNGSIVSKHSSGQIREENKKYPKKSKRKSVKKNQGLTSSFKNRILYPKEIKGERTRRIKK